MSFGSGGAAGVMQEDARHQAEAQVARILWSELFMAHDHNQGINMYAHETRVKKYRMQPVIQSISRMAMLGRRYAIATLYQISSTSSSSVFALDFVVPLLFKVSMLSTIISLQLVPRKRSALTR